MVHKRSLVTTIKSINCMNFQTQITFMSTILMPAASIIWMKILIKHHRWDWIITVNHIRVYILTTFILIVNLAAQTNLQANLQALTCLIAIWGNLSKSFPFFLWTIFSCTIYKTWLPNQNSIKLDTIAIINNLNSLFDSF